MQKVVHASGRASSGGEASEGSLDSVALRQIGGEEKRGPQLTRRLALLSLSEVRHAEVVAGSGRLRLEPFRFFQAGRIPEAITETHALIKQRPRDPALHNTLGALYGRSGDPSQAAREFHEALRLDPKFSPAYVNLGDSYLVRNDRARALQSYLEAGRLTPSSTLETFR